MKALDFYAGIGGWALGLRLAGVQVTNSYELWSSAIKTHEKNNQSEVHDCDIRELKLSNLPKDVDIVVGSPPCTQFSYSNSGGKGNIEDGLVDIEKFLLIIDYLKPKFWAMENVPRVKELLDFHLAKGGRLNKFSKLKIETAIVDMSDYGLPQKRKRCIAGNFDFELFQRYQNLCKKQTLGFVLKSLSGEVIRDPIYKLSIKRANLTDHVSEQCLNAEETRINRELKTFHPVYNNMSFPDRIDAPVRTITATCTRVSRESVVIATPENPKKFRRLTVRERASLQGFPITYQFFGESYAKKLKMIGNAMPPLIAYYIAQAMKGVPPNSLATR